MAGTRQPGSGAAQHTMHSPGAAIGVFQADQPAKNWHAFCFDSCADVLHGAPMKAADPPRRSHAIRAVTSPPDPVVDPGRRALLGATAAAGLGALSLIDPLIRASAWAAGSDAPEKAEVKIGFIPLTDCASVVMASVMGFDKKHGVKIIPAKEASW